MNVMKFGGTSVGSAQRIKNVASLVSSRGRNIVVLSAMSGTTNQLLKITDSLKSGDISEASTLIGQLREKYSKEISELIDDPAYRDEALSKIGGIIDSVAAKLDKKIEVIDEKEIVACGELMSTNMMDCYMRSIGMNVAFLQALDFMAVDDQGEPDLDYIEAHIAPLIAINPDADVYLTQGFICRNADGEIDNLQRGGSDYSASLIGAAVDADEIEIWTDIDGMHNNDPRFVEGTKPVSKLHFEEAAELAYFGAKILHPTCVLPAKNKNIPVRLLNTMKPEAPGTLIYYTEADHKIKAIAAKDDITAIKIKSGRMLLAYGFLRKVFEIFETHRTPIDMITTSEVGVSVTIDNDRNLDAIVEDLSAYGAVTIDRDMVIVCVVGDLEWKNRGFEAEVVNALKEIPIRMISYGGSNYNISVLIRKEDKQKALNLLSLHLFN